MGAKLGLQGKYDPQSYIELLQPRANDSVPQLSLPPVGTPRAFVNRSPATFDSVSKRTASSQLEWHPEAAAKVQVKQYKFNEDMLLQQQQLFQDVKELQAGQLRLESKLDQILQLLSARP